MHILSVTFFGLLVTFGYTSTDYVEWTSQRGITRGRQQSANSKCGLLKQHERYLSELGDESKLDGFSHEPLRILLRVVMITS